MKKKSNVIPIKKTLWQKIVRFFKEQSKSAEQYRKQLKKDGVLKD